MRPVFADTGFFLALINPRGHFEQAGFRALLRG